MRGRRLLWILQIDLIYETIFQCYMVKDKTSAAVKANFFVELKNNLSLTIRLILFLVESITAIGGTV
jgi:hypothetical protein